MTRSANIFFGLFTLGTVIAVAMVQPSIADHREEAIKDYRQWTLITPQAVYMEPTVSALCMPDPIRSDHANPHTPAYFRVFVNDKGKAAMQAKKPQTFPIGSVIVKEKFNTTGPIQKLWDTGKPDATKPKSFDKPNLLTVMVKREKGFDSKNGDWQYYTASGSKKPNSKDLPVSHCQSCHQQVKDKDYTFRTYGSMRVGFWSHVNLLLQHS